MNQPNVYKQYRFPPEIVQYAVWLYYRFNLSQRVIEDLSAERGIIVSIDTVFAVGRKFTMEPDQVLSRFGGQGSQLCYEIRRLEDDMRGARPKALATLMGPAFAVGRFELTTDIA